MKRTDSEWREIRSRMPIPISGWPREITSATRATIDGVLEQREQPAGKHEYTGRPGCMICGIPMTHPDPATTLCERHRKEQPAAQDADVVNEMLHAYYVKPVSGHTRGQMSAALAVARRGMVPAGESFTLDQIEKALISVESHGYLGKSAEIVFKHVLAYLSPPKPKTAQEIVEGVFLSHGVGKLSDLAAEIIAELAGKQ